MAWHVGVGDQVQTLQGYDVREKVYESGNKSVLRVRRERDAFAGVLKFFETDARSHAEIERIKNEFNCLRAVTSAHVIRVHELVFFEHGVGILMDDFRGEVLSAVRERRGRFDLRSFLEVATKLAAGLRDIHREKVIHRDLKPSNVLFHELSGELRIIDFGISKALSHTRSDEQMGSLPYMSPEQTGKMNRSVDLRSDLYSLGVVFFELLTGRCPFTSQDPLELIHCHIARTPEAPSAHEPSIPAPLSRLVLKLLEKEAESRYQSAAGVLADLEMFQTHLARSREIPADFPVGTQDQPEVFRIPEKLYGRKLEIQRLLATFGRVAKGTFEPVLVSGYSGIGKSALINEVQKPLVAARGFFAAGKYEQFNKARPYSAIQQSLGELVRIVLRQSDDCIEAWRAALLGSLRGEGQCLIEVVPLLETLIGPQPELPDAGPVSRQNRFNRSCEALLRVLATDEHPLVLFLDDLQWADTASLELIRFWLEKEIPFVMLILAYRDNEVGPHHPLTSMLRDALKDRAEACEIKLGPLAQPHVEELIGDTLKRGGEGVRRLSAVHMAKTGGNPFFLVQMLRGLHESGLVTFGAQGWSWDIEQITARDLTDNVVELMTRKLHRYPEGTRSTLNMCAILGSEFVLHTLAIVLEGSDASAYQAILPAIEDGLLKEEAGRVRFAHDKIHEASYGLVGPDESKRRHRLVGRHLLETLEPAAVEQQIFKIVDDLNRSRALIDSPTERRELVQLNVRAGHKALASSAFQPAAELFERASELLAEHAWRDDSELAFDTYAGLASANYACARYDLCERCAATCIAQVGDPVRNAPAVQMLLGSLFSQNRHEEAVTIGVHRLALLGVKIPMRPTKPQVLAAYARFKMRQGLRATESLIELPPATDPRAIAAIKILNALSHSAYTVSADLYGFVAIQMAQLSLRFGNTAFSPFAYAACMGTEAGAFKAVSSAQAYLRLAFAVNDKYPNLQQRGQIELIRCTVALHQTGSIEGWEQEVAGAVACNLDAGALNMADYSFALTRAQALFFGTRSLNDVYAQNVDVLRLHQRHGSLEIIENQLLILHTLAAWRDGGSERSLEPEVAQFQLEEYARKLAKPGNIVTRGYLTLIRQVQQYLEGDYEGALRTGLAFKIQALDLLGIMVEHMHRFLYLLSYLAADHGRLGMGERAAAAAYYRVNRALFAIYDRNAPNYRSHLALIIAEEERLLGRTVEALRSYERAIDEARKVSRFNEILSYRRLGAFHRSQGLVLEAEWVAGQAWRVCQSFAFRSEMRRIEAEFPELASGQGADSQVTPRGKSSGSTSSTTFALRLGVESLARAAQAISSQVRLEGLIEVLLRQLCQSSAAQRAVLLLHEGGVLRVQGEIVITGQEAELSVLKNIAFPAKRGEAMLAETLVQFVSRVGRPEVLDNAAQEGDFTEDPYIRARRPKSILCRPVFNRGKLLGVLYLENNLAARAFTAEHQEVLEVLASQAAIAFENAGMYRDLERKVEERTAELNRKTNDLNGMLQNLDQGVFTILQGGLIHAEYSNKLESILGTRAIAGRDYRDVLFVDATLAPDVLSQLQAAVAFSIGEDVLWYESNRHLLVCEALRRHPDGTLRTLELCWSPILDGRGKVEKLLVSVRDVTELRRLEQEAREQRTDLELIGTILSLPREVFLGFLQESSELVARSERRLSGQSRDAESLGALFRDLHTLKGNARTFSFNALASAAHEAEDTYASCRASAGKEWDLPRMQRDVAHVRECLERIRGVYEHHLKPMVAAGDRNLAIDAGLLRQIRAAASDARFEDLVSLVDAMGTTSLEEIVAGLAPGMGRLARDLGKAVPSLRVHSAGVRFRADVIPVVRDVFMHLLRNALDHGIETASERRTRGKPDEGEVAFVVRPCANGCEIRVRDDGRGLAVAPLRAVARRLNLAAESDADLAELVFRAGVSTADSVGEISGRGVGMDVVRRWISERGGRVELELESTGEEPAGTWRAFTTKITMPARSIAWSREAHEGSCSPL